MRQKRLADVARRDALTIVGLMSGTSGDGIDAAVVRVRDRRDTGGADRLEIEILGGGTHAYDDAFRARVVAAGSADATELARLHAELGHRMASATLRAIGLAGLRVEDVDAVGSHGQTVAHVPGAGGAGGESRRAGAATLQIGCPARVAEATGLPVVSDLRARDTAAGGEGAPLVPLVDWMTLRPESGARLVQNIGGVGNVTLVTQRAADVRAFDTGPGNGPLDAAARRLLGSHSDRDGAAAAAGTPDEREVAELLAHPWFATPPPRSLARETFGDAVVEDLLARRPEMTPEAVLATLTEFVARSIARAGAEHVEPAAGVRDVVVSGGGVHNPVLMGRLTELFAPLPVMTSAALGFDPDAREAVAFAVLAYLTLRGRPGNLPCVTGAHGPRVLGSITLP